MLLKDKVVLITGGVSGIGLAFVKELLNNDIKGIMIADVDAVKGQQLVTLLQNQYGPNKAIFNKLDVTNEKEFSDIFQKTVDAFGNLDIVINSAGHVEERKMSNLVDVNLKGVITGTILAMDQYLPKYRSIEESLIINMSSVYGLDGCGCFPIYSATKFGVIGFGEAMSIPCHYERTKVKILTICPGYTGTAILDDLENKTRLGRYQDVLKAVSENIYIQKPETVSTGLIKILKSEYKSGEVWIIEDEQTYQVELPKRTELKRIRTLN